MVSMMWFNFNGHHAKYTDMHVADYPLLLKAEMGEKLSREFAAHHF